MPVLEAQGSLVETVQQRESEAEAASRTKYREILEQNDPGDAKALRDVMGKLNITTERLAKDLAAVQKARELTQKAGPADDPELTSKISEAHDEFVRYDEETKRFAAERKAEGQRLWSAWQTLSGKQESARNARRRLAELRMQNRELFGVPAPEPEPAAPAPEFPAIDDDYLEGINKQNAIAARSAAHASSTSVPMKTADGQVVFTSGAVSPDRYERLSPDEEAAVMRQVARGEKPHLPAD